jgi:hypothetical protein
VLNFTSLLEGIPRIGIVPPTVDPNTPEFNYDLFYANWLLGSPEAFNALMSLMMLVYNGYDVFLCCGSMDIVGFLNESFMKFMQQRYGINCYWVNEPSDFDFCTDSGAVFSIEGLGNFDVDKERLTMMTVTQYMQENQDNDIWRNYHEDAIYRPVV